MQLVWVPICQYRALPVWRLGRHGAVLVEEVVDGPVSGAFDFSIDVASCHASNGIWSSSWW